MSACDDLHGPAVGIAVGTQGILFWQCRTCSRRWHTHPVGTIMRARAEPFVTRTLEARHAR
jgi:hypothetical protein